jgi:hypothetical protein
MFPVDVETKKVHVELFGFVDREDPEDGFHAIKLNAHVS